MEEFIGWLECRTTGVLFSSQYLGMLCVLPFSKIKKNKKSVCTVHQTIGERKGKNLQRFVTLAPWRKVGESVWQTITRRCRGIGIPSYFGCRRNYSDSEHAVPEECTSTRRYCLPLSEFPPSDDWNLRGGCRRACHSRRLDHVCGI